MPTAIRDRDCAVPQPRRSPARRRRPRTTAWGGAEEADNRQDDRGHRTCRHIGQVGDPAQMRNRSSSQCADRLLTTTRMDITVTTLRGRARAGPPTYAMKLCRPSWSGPRTRPMTMESTAVPISGMSWEARYPRPPMTAPLLARVLVAFGSSVNGATPARRGDRRRAPG